MKTHLDWTIGPAGEQRFANKILVHCNAIEQVFYNPALPSFYGMAWCVAFSFVDDIGF